MLGIQCAALALAATALAMSGCGGSSKGSSTVASTIASSTTAAPTTPASATPVAVASGTPLTRAQLLAAGDAICARRNARLASVAVRSTADFVRLMPQIAIYDTSEASELSKLVPPVSMRSSWAQIITDFHLYGEDMNNLAKEAPQHNTAVLGATFKASESVRKRIDALTKRASFRQCSKRRL